MTHQEIDQAIAERGNCPVQIDGVHVNITRSCYPYRYGYAFVWRGEGYSGSGALTPVDAMIAAREELAELQAENTELRQRLTEANAMLAKFGVLDAVAPGRWLRFGELTEAQEDQTAAMFSGDFYAGRDSAAVLSYRASFGYFIDGAGNVMCRRKLTQIRNWNATDPWQA